MLLNAAINLMLLLNLILINCLTSFSEDIPIPTLVSNDGQCYVKIDGKSAKLYKFSEDYNGKKIWRFLFTNSNDKMQILHEKTDENLFKCGEIEDVLDLWTSKREMGIFYGHEPFYYYHKGVGITLSEDELEYYFVKLGLISDDDNRCKAFNASRMTRMNGKVANILKVFSQFKIYKCPINETGKRILDEVSEFVCHTPNLFIPIGKRIYRIDVKYEGVEYNLSIKKRIPIDHNHICYFQSDFEQIQFYKGQSKIEHIKNKIVQHKGALTTFGIGCAIGYTFCNLMNRN